MSIAVLRTFISKRQQEHEARLLSKKMKIGAKKVDEPISEPEAMEHDEKSNGGCDISQDISQDEPCSISENSAANQGRKVPEDLKPPRVLEVIEFVLLVLFPLQNNYTAVFLLYCII